MKPPIVIPEEMDITVDDIFRPLDESLVPQIADVIARLRVEDPDVLAAVEDVDRTLIWGAFDEDPFDRLIESVQTARFYARLKASL